MYELKLDKGSIRISRDINYRNDFIFNSLNSKLGAALVSTFKVMKSMIQVEVCNLRKTLQNLNKC